MTVGPGWVICIVLSITAMAATAEIVIGFLNYPVVLPCSYPVYNYSYVCWGRGRCLHSWCDKVIIRTEGTEVMWNASSRYQLLGEISQGDLSLTITGATKEDEGTYCCRADIPRSYYDQKIDVELKIQEIEECPDDTD